MKLPALNSVLGGYLVFTFLYFSFLVLSVYFSMNESGSFNSVFDLLNTQIRLLYYFFWFWIILIASSTAGMVYNTWKMRKFQPDMFFYVFVLSSIVLFCKVV